MGILFDIYFEKWKILKKWFETIVLDEKSILKKNSETLGVFIWIHGFTIRTVLWK